MKGLKQIIIFAAKLIKSGFSIWRTVFFNFHYFPFSIAVRFPIFLYKSVRFKKIKGQIIIDSLPIKTGMIHIGKEMYGFQWKHDYTIWEQKGGTVVFEDAVSLGKGTFVTIGKNAILKFEQYVSFGGNDRIMCRESILIKAHTIAAWDVLIIDTDFRATINTITNTKNLVKKAITIGRNNWLCFGSTVLKGSITPDYCIVGAKSLINKDFSNAGEHVVIGMENSAKVLTKYTSWDCLGVIDD